MEYAVTFFIKYTCTHSLAMEALKFSKLIMIHLTFSDFTSGVLLASYIAQLLLNGAVRIHIKRNNFLLGSTLEILPQGVIPHITRLQHTHLCSSFL